MLLNNRALTRLGITHQKLEGAAIAPLAQALIDVAAQRRLQKRVSSTSLVVSSYDGSDDDADDDAGGGDSFRFKYKINGGIQRIALSGNPLGDEGWTLLARALGATRSIAWLHGSDTKLGNEGAKALAEALNTNTSIRNLDLANHLIDDEGAKALCHALTKNSTIVHMPGLASRRSRISAPVVKELQRLLSEQHLSQLQRTQLSGAGANINHFIFALDDSARMRRHDGDEPDVETAGTGSGTHTRWQLQQAAYCKFMDQRMQMSASDRMSLVLSSKPAVERQQRRLLHQAERFELRPRYGVASQSDSEAMGEMVRLCNALISRTDIGHSPTLVMILPEIDRARTATSSDSGDSRPNADVAYKALAEGLDWSGSKRHGQGLQVHLIVVGDAYTPRPAYAKPALKVQDTIVRITVARIGRWSELASEFSLLARGKEAAGVAGLNPSPMLGESGAGGAGGAGGAVDGTTVVDKQQFTFSGAATLPKIRHKLKTSFDSNGVLYFLGTSVRGQPPTASGLGGSSSADSTSEARSLPPYRNPHASGEVFASETPQFGGQSLPERFVQHSHDGRTINVIMQSKIKPLLSGTAGGSAAQGGLFMSVDLGAGTTLVPNYYCLRHGYEQGDYRLANWRLEGSNDGSSWVMLRQHDNDSSIPNEGFGVGHWPVEGVTRGYRHFRVYMHGNSHKQGQNMYCAGIELYGELRVDRVVYENGKRGQQAWSWPKQQQEVC
jgi:hypothetical protein